MELNVGFGVHSELDKLVLNSFVSLSDEKGDFLDDIKRYSGFTELHNVPSHKSVEFAVDASFSNFTLNGDKVI